MPSTQPMPAQSTAASALSAVLVACVSVLVHFALVRGGATELVPVAGSLATAVVIGLPLTVGALRRDELQTQGGPATVPGLATVVLAVMLMAAWTGTGSLGYLSKELPGGGEPSAVARSVGMRELPLVLGVVFATSVAAGHRLRGRARPALTTAVLAFTGGVLATNQMFLRYWNASQIPEHVYVPIVIGVLSWCVGRLGLRYAVRTQDRYDALYAVRVRFREGGEPPQS
ncbi:hypothetical protein OG889_44880 [Streptomyces sp. NBC_00481]|uniref:hypothetical protein n=1 Tax=Streptomyces sp. NBC_00481 TaxID=2975755 RepID=UPI002DD899A4|nr:hypothetical protein [Streptomyces sp. NBC_00481]WRZ01192.1 hypothetical protein OG889_44880 [Streptomyces sp. NBC_00481]